MSQGAGCQIVLRTAGMPLHATTEEGEQDCIIQLCAYLVLHTQPCCWYKMSERVSVLAGQQRTWVKWVSVLYNMCQDRLAGQ